MFIDGSYVKAHQHASGARYGEERAIGISRGGPTTKLHFAADSHGNPIDFEVTGGEVYDSQIANKIIEKISCKAKNIIADKGYDSDDIRLQIWAQGARAIIPRRVNSKKSNLGFDYTFIQATTSHRKSFCKVKELSKNSYTF